eukprot:CAMPEP_0116834968 /NCGR_PEP_ID=MMETSP0418-20121206/7281_1 /TAXON_ID=1158023 /ORGANISM="Astrosyne radiata, Strain 13vi08-1A" /LENGTH=233 /DNA_ID=CAMNT_0004464577 /DNA_START=129 /DNA_END=827 /DNA_ORIENTATION=+
MARVDRERFDLEKKVYKGPWKVEVTDTKTPINDPRTLFGVPPNITVLEALSTNNRRTMAKEDHVPRPASIDNLVSGTLASQPDNNYHHRLSRSHSEHNILFTGLHNSSDLATRPAVPVPKEYSQVLVTDMAKGSCVDQPSAGHMVDRSSATKSNIGSSVLLENSDNSGDKQPVAVATTCGTSTSYIPPTSSLGFFPNRGSEAEVIGLGLGGGTVTPHCRSTATPDNNSMMTAL